MPDFTLKNQDGLTMIIRYEGQIQILRPLGERGEIDIQKDTFKITAINLGKITL